MNTKKLYTFLKTSKKQRPPYISNTFSSDSLSSFYFHSLRGVEAVLLFTATQINGHWQQMSHPCNQKHLHR